METFAPAHQQQAKENPLHAQYELRKSIIVQYVIAC